MIGSKSSCSTKPVPTHPITANAPIRPPPSKDGTLAPERTTPSSASAARAAVQTAGPPGSAARDANSPTGSVSPPRAVRTGAKMPFSVAWATTAKTSSTVSARRLPAPASTVRRETQPRVSTMPIPKSRPPMTMPATGKSAAMKRCAEKSTKPSSTAPCVPSRATASAASQTPRAAPRSAAVSPATARRRQKRVSCASTPNSAPRPRPKRTLAVRGSISRPSCSYIEIVLKAVCHAQLGCLSRLCNCPLGNVLSVCWRSAEQAFQSYVSWRKERLVLTESQNNGS